MKRLEKIIELFRNVDTEMKVNLLLDYANKLPPLPKKFHEARDAGINRVPECVTPVFLFLEYKSNRLCAHIDVAEEAPTLKGLLAIVVNVCNEAKPDEKITIPDNLVEQLGLENLIRMNRLIGLSAVLTRINRQITQLVTN